MSEGELQELKSDVEELKDSIGRIEGALATLTTLVVSRSNKTDKKLDSKGKWDLVFKFGTGLILPIILATIGAYAAIKGASAK